MLRFNNEFNCLLDKKITFQYILCYGSTIKNCRYKPYKHAFQYILCYGSTMEIHPIQTNDPNFNTSYVTVQLFWLFGLVLDYPNFNTSYVTVQL